MVFVKCFILKLIIIAKAERFDQSPNESLFRGEITEDLIHGIGCWVKELINSGRVSSIVSLQQFFARCCSSEISHGACAVELVFSVFAQFSAGASVSARTLITALVNARLLFASFFCSCLYSINTNKKSVKSARGNNDKITVII